MQAKLWCTPSRARKVVVSLIVVVLAAHVIEFSCWHFPASSCFDIFVTVTGLIKGILPVPVLVINLVVAFKVRRAATNAAANLGVQPHHHTSTSSSSAVPTVMLVATSVIYVLLYSPARLLQLTYYHTDHKSEGEMSVLIFKIYVVAGCFEYLVFVYNFYIYLITGRQFRSELRKLFCRCLHSTSTPAATTVMFTDNTELTMRVNQTHVR